MIAVSHLSTRVVQPVSLGVLSIHLDGAPCRVGCEFCYLGGRSDQGGGELDLDFIEGALARLTYDEVAVALSEPTRATLSAIERIARATKLRQRPLAITTTLSVAASVPSLACLGDRINLSVDPAKGPVSPQRVASVAGALKAERVAVDLVLLATLTTREFAARLVDDGLLEALVDLPQIDKVALNGLKPPPVWCDRAFWLGTLARLQRLLARALDDRLFLDCYVAARLLHTGGCPARADLSPAKGGVAFRSCVYQPAPDFVTRDLGRLEGATNAFSAPALCPFDTRL